MGEAEVGGSRPANARIPRAVGKGEDDIKHQLARLLLGVEVVNAVHFERAQLEGALNRCPPLETDPTVAALAQHVVTIAQLVYARQLRVCHGEVDVGAHLHFELVNRRALQFFEAAGGVDQREGMPLGGRVGEPNSQHRLARNGTQRVAVHDRVLSLASSPFLDTSTWQLTAGDLANTSCKSWTAHAKHCFPGELLSPGI